MSERAIPHLLSGQALKDAARAEQLRINNDQKDQR